MGPTNIALVKLSQADKRWRDAVGRLESASHSVRVQERRLADFREKLALAQTRLREEQSRGGQLDLDIKSRDVRIDRLRSQQQNAKNNKEYQAFLTEINTEKIDKAKTEEEFIKVLEIVENGQAAVKQLHAQIDDESKKHAANKEQLSGQLSELQAEIDRLKPLRDAAAEGVPLKAREAFERLADRYEGEALVPLSKPDRRTEEYICSSCNMALVTDIYNRLHSRDELVFCPNCRKILYIPEDLPPEMAIGRGKPEPSAKAAAAPKRRKVASAKPAKAVSAPAMVESDPGESEGPPVVIEQRAKGHLGEVLAKAQRESVERAVAADSKPVECDVAIDGEVVGIYKGINRDHLERCVTFYLEEEGIKGMVLVTERVEKGAEGATEPVAEAAPEAADASAPVEAAAPETPAS